MEIGQQKRRQKQTKELRLGAIEIQAELFLVQSLKPKRRKKKQSCATTTTDSTSHSRWYTARWNTAATTFLHRCADGTAAARSFRLGDDCADADSLLFPVAVAAAAGCFLLGAIRLRIHSRTLLLLLLPPAIAQLKRSG